MINFIEIDEASTNNNRGNRMDAHAQSTMGLAKKFLHFYT